MIRGSGYGEFRPIRRLTFALGVRGQYATQPLLSFEEFSAGNYTVGRGYDPGTLLGDRGIGVQAEIRAGSVFPRSRKSVGLEGYAFFDHARIGNKDRLFVDDSSRKLSSVGAGARASWNRFYVDAAVALPLTHVGLENKKPDPRFLGFVDHPSLALERPMTVQPMRVALASRQVRGTRRRLMWSCAAAAIAVTAGNTAQQARAQAFAGTPTLPNPNIAVDGSATRTITGGTTETITVSTNKATINWTSTDNAGSGTIDFLPAGNVATFTNDPLATADFTVLNRIVPADPTRAIALNGSVISTLQSVSGTATGGHVWFYSPGGIIVGASAVFNVGGLLLTVNDPVSYDATANGFTGHFTAAANSTASVTIDPGAKIDASPENSYVALVAPRVVQGGDVSVNGSAAYVAGEDVTLTMNQGLFDIQVDVGTSDPFSTDGPNGIVHTGTTGGPASTGAGDNQKIYMVAVPKNQALTMLLSGNAGFTPAGAAQVVNGEIVLSAGWSIFDTGGSRSISSPITSDASIQIDPGTYTSNVFANRARRYHCDRRHRRHLVPRERQFQYL